MASVIDRERAAIQRRTRGQHSWERAQDYVEAIQALIAVSGETRATDLAKWLGVTHVTVIRTVQRLRREGLVSNRPYRSIFLTESGRKLAVESKARHETVVAFLEALGIPHQRREPMRKGWSTTSAGKRSWRSRSFLPRRFADQRQQAWQIISVRTISPARGCRSCSRVVRIGSRSR